MSADAANSTPGTSSPSLGTWETPSPVAEVEHPSMEVDIACAGFGPAMGGFLTTLTSAWNENPADPAFESKVVPGMPLQVLCYERADDLASGVSGVVTRAQGIRASFPDLNLLQIPMSAKVTQERMLYLLDPIGASRRSSHVACSRLGVARPLSDARRPQSCLPPALDTGIPA